MGDLIFSSVHVNFVDTPLHDVLGLRVPRSEWPPASNDQ